MGFKAAEVQDYVGRGITLPLKLSGGRAPLESGFELIRASIIMILAWPIFTRFFLTEFGSRVEELLEEPNDDVLLNVIETFVVDSLSMWETRVELLDVSVVRTDRRINLELSYRVVATRKEDSFIFPFYTQINT
jgi:phage baseplate assembly protein W